MHARDLVEVAAMVVTHATQGARPQIPLPEQGIRNYWSASRCRIDRWTRSIAEYSQADQPNVRRRWRLLQPVLEEILVGEILTRVWTAFACACDRENESGDLEPVVTNIWRGHLDVRRRVLNLMVSGQGLRVSDAVALNRLRRSAERWCDTLLSRLGNTPLARRFAFSRRRVQEFAQELRTSAHPDLSWAILRASFRASFELGLSRQSANGDLNRQIAAAILTCIEPDSFDSTGQFRSVWLMRLEQAANDTDGMIQDLLATEAPPLTRSDFHIRGSQLGRK